MCAITVPTLALDAARAAFAIASSAETSEPIVLTGFDYADPRAALDAALVADEHPGLSYCTVTVLATHDIHGTRLASSAHIPALEGGFVTVVVELHAELFVSTTTRIPVINELRREVERLAEASGAYISRIAYVIN